MRALSSPHGLDRAAEDFRDVMVEQAERTGQILLVPEFDAAQFPYVYAYNQGNVRRPPPNDTVFPRDLWNFGIIDRLFEYARTAVGSDRETFGLFGNSAGAQFVLRYLALNEATAAAVAANSGWYMLPDLAVGYTIRHARSRSG
jgi:pimeloyl-ACP methyl ester carboxylesterase